MRKILGLTIVALIVMGLVGGGTWAYFSDTETTTGNALTAGTLDLGVANVSGSNPTGGATATWTSPSNWAPGDNVTAILYVNNEGTIDMSTVNVTFSSVFTDGTPGTITPLPGGSTDNLTQMIIAESATWNSGNVAAITGNSLATLISTGSINLGTLPANTEYPLEIVWRFSTTATNGCQGDSENVTLSLIGTQQ